MGDSDDEYDRRRGRDKFRRERSDYQDRRDDRGRREDWPERNRDSWGRDRGRRDNYNRDYDSRRRDRYSPMRHDMSPPQAKRMRRDMDVESGTVQPPMMTFKQFLASQEDTIDDQEAVRKYNEYKLDFRRKQLNKFFMTHKEEEWFKSRYHPEECLKRESDVLKALKRRLAVFMEFFEQNKLDTFSIDLEKQEDITKLLDSVVIKLEGGSDFDLKALDELMESEKKEEPVIKDDSQSETRSQEGDKKENEKSASNGQMNMSTEQKELQRQAQEYLAQKQQTEIPDEPPVPSPPKEEKRRKRHREYSYDENDESGTESDSGSAGSSSEPAPPGVENNDPQPPASDSVEENQNNNALEDIQLDPAADEMEEPEESEKKELEEKNKSTENKLEEGEEEGIEVAEAGKEEKEENKKEAVPTPCPLHKTSSIFLRNLAPTITKQEVEAMCKRYPGFLRVAIADPQPERRFFRRGWVTFDRTVNIKEICWNLNNIRLRDCELGAIVNRDLSRRIRPVNSILVNKQIVKNDLKLAAKIIQNYDNRFNLWADEEKADSEKQSFGLMSRNPIMRNVTDYLIEEASAEEEELLGTAITQDEKPKEINPEVSMERDETLLKVLDRLLLYLRIVYSIDYYNASDYPNEDEMPNRCGIMHARSPPINRVTQNDVNEWINNFEHKLQPFLIQENKLNDSEASTLGKKDHKVEVEKFVAANTQELTKDKWLCPLSGKKFKGPEYVRKHIFNKHAEKIEEVKKEVEYFNNYLFDPKRPQLPEHPGVKVGPMGGRGDNFDVTGGFVQGQPHALGSGYGGQPRPPMMGYQGPGFNFPQYQRGGNYDLYNRSHSFPKMRGRGGRDPRELIHYRDLDAPDDMDIF